MNDEQRKAIEDVLSDWHVLARAHKAVGPVQAVLEEALAREAEHATLVTPEWMDGAEAKRLGFERVSNLSQTWSCVKFATEWKFGRMVRVELYSVHENMVMQDTLGNRTIHYGVPTIRQVRLAVELATGRR